MRLSVVRTREVAMGPKVQFLIGPAGETVWCNLPMQEPFILAARNKREREAVAALLRLVIEDGFVPFGIPIEQPIQEPLRGCRWASSPNAPSAQGDSEYQCSPDELPRVARAVCLPQEVI